MRSFAGADRPLIYAITDGRATAENFASAVAAISGQVREAVEENISMVQIREKHLSGKNLFELASVCSKITRGSRTKLLVNGRVDIAEAAGADGVHLTGTSIPTLIVRGSFGNELVIGVSVHTAKEAEAANRKEQILPPSSNLAYVLPTIFLTRLLTSRKSTSSAYIFSKYEAALL